MSYLDELNPSQREAAESIEGPTMVIAGAGSGKTRVLTFRIAFMMENGVDPFNILALTFTNKAAKEMTERIGKIVGPGEAKNITMGTFHSVFSRILRFNADRLGYPTNFTIYDTQDSKSLLKDIIKELNLDDKIYKPGMVLSRISSAKNNLISADAYEQNNDIMGEDIQSRRPELFQIYKTYVTRCFKAGAMDFDDLLFQTNVLLRDYPDVLHFYQQKFKYILVDEYQDTNYAQYLIVKKLAAVYENLCVVGDDAQSIYSFRGANIQNILNFRKDYPDFKLFKLEQNYRSTKNIVEAANSVIARNQDQIKKSVWTDNVVGSKLRVVRTLTDNEEGRVISSKIFDLKQGGIPTYNDFAILYRTNKQSRSFEEALRKLNIPYKIYGGVSFYQRKEIKDLLSYFRLTTNPRDEEALKRVINYPKRGIGKTSIENMIIAANTYGVSMWDVISNMNQYPVALNAGTKAKLYEFITMINSFSAQLDKLNAYDLAQTIAKSSGILRELHGEKDKGPEEVERYQNIEELLAGIKEFTISKEEDSDKSLAEFMIDVALLTDADLTSENEEKNHVTMMTIHSSKGLEFPHVFLVGLEENLFPSQMALHSRTELEEERRLFYVALTRAMNSCTLSYASSRFNWGQLVTSEPSRFIDEIEQSYLEFESPQRGGGRSLSGRSTFDQPHTGGLNKSFSSPTPPPSFKPMQQASGASKSTGSNENLKVGYIVNHDRFGKGKVTKLEGDGADKKATIFFPHHGAKTVLLRFANLTILEE
ncbi:MAG: UvrD-helicase domain-containing protein [Crocinitomicaceae bacterium]|jgi:DNA helicase II / ATP-dependent DNA helicase PcrA|nr:UvrD-helicase domain-containing protein [Crocinitomicaceae bacterium]MDP4637859.1 UvrD-helicase domain-containing protein [Crocinitomicaceae bacterium]MDP4684275.1 UvrD-helicase domain-containing protein [Crocinitomicaceae bacterium]MDP4798173.1 UvrD-helicase domain-containing protein [Crocinitomicaceae bacterium]MDP4867221.1 UvrD-helicase domain-containing protein [Crocinitomicaceae bacterium]